ncbi:helix-turn-helix transcriptional regulator [Streptomyces sp. H51]|uniref:helix-turn-helix domain-containing protein n=1 Tax=Streptomyces sp. H51 TaxID=3111770 RepID=UPI002D77CC5D|nr:helix-turn-helix transcriptional regulator [Streptomyces sp. H51]
MDRPPFRPAAAVSARQRLGISTFDVARQMKLVGTPVDTDTVAAWETGTHRPTEGELFALADVLWCRTIELMGMDQPRTLAELRLARQFTVARLARDIGMHVDDYTRAEENNQWPGNFTQTLGLLHALNISFRQLEEVTAVCTPMDPALPALEPGPARLRR